MEDDAVLLPLGSSPAAPELRRLRIVLPAAIDVTGIRMLQLPEASGAVVFDAALAPCVTELYLDFGLNLLQSVPQALSLLPNLRMLRVAEDTKFAPAVAKGFVGVVAPRLSLLDFYGDIKQDLIEHVIACCPALYWLLVKDHVDPLETLLVAIARGAQAAAALGNTVASERKDGAGDHKGTTAAIATSSR